MVTVQDILEGFFLLRLNRARVNLEANLRSKAHRLFEILSESDCQII